MLILDIFFLIVCNNVPRKIRAKECEQQSQASSGTIKKKKYSKPHSRRKKCTEPVADKLSLLLHPESFESGTTNGDCIEAAIDNTSYMGRNQNSTWSSGKLMLSGITNDAEHPLDHMSCLDSTLLSITNGEVVDSSNGHFCTGKRRAKLQSKRKKCMELAEDSHSFSSHPESLEYRRTNGEDVGSSFVDKETRVLKRQKRRKRSNKPLVEGPILSVPCQQDGLEISTCDNISSKQILGTGDQNDITLACFLRNKSKKRRLEVAKNANQACSPSTLKMGADSVPNEVDKLGDGNQILSTQGGEPRTHCHVENPDKLLPGRQDLVQGQKNAGLQEPVSINLDGDPEESYDITLACFLRKKLKKR